MLVALISGTDDRLEAQNASKANSYSCPGCGSLLNLAKGRIRRPYFAHKKGAICGYAVAETWEHQKTKEDLLNAFRERGLQASPEEPVLSIEGDRRADILVTSPNGKKHVALEVQHSSLDTVSLAARVKAYVAADIGVIWIPIISFKKLEPTKLVGTNVLRVRQLAVPPWWHWLYVFHETLWTYEPSQRELWRMKILPHHLWKNESSWFADGSEQSSGGYWYDSTRWADVYFQGPFLAQHVRIKPFQRETQNVEGSQIPKGRRAEIVLDTDLPEWPLRRERYEHKTEYGNSGFYEWIDQVLINGVWQTPSGENLLLNNDTGSSAPPAPAPRRRRSSGTPADAHD